MVEARLFEVKKKKTIKVLTPKYELSVFARMRLKGSSVVSKHEYNLLFTRENVS